MKIKRKYTKVNQIIQVIMSRNMNFQLKSKKFFKYVDLLKG